MSGKDERIERLARQLRENLRKRKALARAQAEAPPDPQPEPTSDPSA